MSTIIDAPRLAPHSTEAEQSILGAVLLNNEMLATVRDLVGAADFYHTAHQMIYRAMLDLSDRGVAVDNLTLTEDLRSKGMLADIGGAAYLAELVGVIGSTANIAHHARIVAEKARLRTLRSQLRMATEAMDNGADLDDVTILIDRLRANTTEQDVVSEAPSGGDLGPFPEDSWRGPFQVYREAMRGTSEAPDTAHFSGLWAVAAACLRRRVSFYYAFPHYPNVYLVNFGNTGDSKTSAARQSLRLLPEHGVKLLRGVGSAEALGDWMQQPGEGPAVSHLLFIEELATLLTRGGWEGSTLLSFLTETFDAPERYEIPFRKNPVLVQEPTPTLMAGTTIEWLWKGLKEIDVHGGFGNRIFYMTGAPKPPIPLPAKPNPEALAEVRGHLQRLTEHPATELFFMPEAQALWKDFYIAWKSTQWSELTTAAVKRIPAYIVKLSMVYACLEETSLITADQLSAAIKVGHYGAKCADRLMNRHRQVTVQGKCEARVLAVLEDRDLPAWKIHRRISGSYSAEELTRALRALSAAGVIAVVGKTKRQEPIYGRRDRKRAV